MRRSVAYLSVLLAAGCSSFGSAGPATDAGMTADDASDPGDAGVASDAPVDGAALVDADANADAEAGCTTPCASGVCTGGTCDPAVFLTSASFSGDLGGLSGADLRCQGRAAAAKLPGIFKAWVSTATQGPLTRFTKRTSSYRKVDGTLVAGNFTELTSGLLRSPIDLTELRTKGNNLAWTATNATGMHAPEGCNDWNEGVQGVGRAGRTDAIDGQWSLVANGYGCSVALALYCVEQ